MNWRANIITFLFFMLMATGSMKAQENVAQQELISEFVFDYLSIKYPNMELDTFIYVGVERQEMFLFVNGKIERVYSVSTSKHGAGEMYGSNCTPIGLHCIKGKYGDGVPRGGIMRGRKFTGEVAEIQCDPIETGRDEITSRVITIKGLEDGINKGGELDTYSRKIYIHGTAEEGLIGRPASHGCIRMLNDDVIELFAMVDTGLPIIILNN